jgi:hypothetical protein
VGRNTYIAYSLKRDRTCHSYLLSPGKIISTQKQTFTNNSSDLMNERSLLVAIVSERLVRVCHPMGLFALANGPTRLVGGIH